MTMLIDDPAYGNSLMYIDQNPSNRQISSNGFPTTENHCCRTEHEGFLASLAKIEKSGLQVLWDLISLLISLPKIVFAIYTPEASQPFALKPDAM
jgi:hypothetical protein